MSQENFKPLYLALQTFITFLVIVIICQTLHTALPYKVSSDTYHQTHTNLLIYATEVIGSSCAWEITLRHLQQTPSLTLPISFHFQTSYANLVLIHCVSTNGRPLDL